MPEPRAIRRRKRDVLAALGQPKVAVMLALGFSSGLPFLLTGNTLGYWLRDEGTTLKAIGFLSWVGLAYSLKFLWAPIVDRVDAPLFGRFGRRRSWMILTQMLVGIGLVGMSSRARARTHGGRRARRPRRLRLLDAGHRRRRLAHRGGERFRRARAAVRRLSARVPRGAAGDRRIDPDHRANHLGWPVSYTMMGVLMGVGRVREPHGDRTGAGRGPPRRRTRRLLWSFRGFADAVSVRSRVLPRLRMGRAADARR